MSRTSLIVSWMVGDRDAGSAHQFMKDLAGRLSHRVQLTTDGHAAYLSAVENNFGSDIDYAMLVKIYGATREPVRAAILRSSIRQFHRGTTAKRLQTIEVL